MFFNYKKNQAWAENLQIIMQIGLTMIGCIFFCLFIGIFLDNFLGTRPIFIIIFIILGVLGGANTVYRQILKITPINEKKGRVIRK